MQAFFDLFGEAGRISRGMKSFLSKDCGSLMVSVTVALRSRESGYQNIGPEGADDAYDIRQGHIVPVLLLEGLVRTFGKSEVGDAGEPLVDSVVLVRRGHFQSAQHAQHVGKIAAYYILATLAAIQGQQRNGNALPA